MAQQHVKLTPHVFVLFGAPATSRSASFFPACTTSPRPTGCLGSTQSSDRAVIPRAPTTSSATKCGPGSTNSSTTSTMTSCENFLSRLSFQTSSADDGADLAAAVSAARERLGHDARTLIYLSVPPTAMQSMIGMLGREHLAGDARVIIEKPFGTDLASSRDLDAALKEVLDEEQVYRIDHFLGKEAVQNILALRFANCLIESAWPASIWCRSRSTCPRH